MSTPTDPQESWDHELAAMQDPAADWLWPGFLARGNITMLISLWKSGKTTLLSHLLAQRKPPGGSLADLPVLPGKSVVISEEPRSLWAERCRKLDLGGNVCFFCQPFLHVPDLAEWRALLQRIANLHELHPLDLLVIDPIAHFFHSENLARDVLATLMPLRALTARGLAVLLLHHPKKADAAPGMAGRGSGALHSHVDIYLEMRHAGPNLDTRARRFFALSRHPETPPHFLFELNQEGTAYRRLHDAPEDDQSSWDVLRMVLEDASKKLTRQDILDDWPPDFPKPCPAALWKWLTAAAQKNLIATEGTGRKSDPFRYWLPQSEARWRQNPLYVLLEKQNQDIPFLFPEPGPQAAG